MLTRATTILLLILWSLLRAADTPDAVIQAVPIDRSIQLTGRLDDPMWQKGKPVSLDYEFEPGDNTPAPQKTSVRALYNQELVYLGFQCYDSRPGEIRANLSERDKIFQDDYVMVTIDTYGDFQRAYEFALNPYGIQADQMITLNNEDPDFDMIWYSAAAKNDSGWTAEMAIPFKSLRFPNRDEQVWRIHLVRNYPRASQTKMSWMPIDRANPSFLIQAGHMQGLTSIATSRSFEFLPYAMGQQSEALRDAGRAPSGWRREQMQSRFGFGLQYAPRPNLAVDAVYNPDFSQIESDADQISVNTTFALDYPEKRPFFLIGQELLQTPMYYSRSINNPLFAGRVIGKSGSLSYLYMGAQDRNTSFIIPGEESSDTVPSDVVSIAQIGRLRYDFGNENYLGGMLFSRNFSNAHNLLLGVDWNYKIRKWYFSGETFLTHTKELNDTTLFQSSRPFGRSGFDAGLNGETYYGNGLHAVLSYNSRSYNFGVVYNDFSPTYQTYNGMFPSVDYRQCYMEHIYKIYHKNSFIDRTQLYAAANLQFNHRNVHKEQFIQPGFSLILKGQTTIDLSYLMFYDERFAGLMFKDIDKVLFSVISRPSNSVSVSIEGKAGNFVYRSTSPEMGNGYLVDATISLKPTTKLNGSFSYSTAYLADMDSDALFYQGHILRAVLLYQFSSRSMFRTILQYNSFDQTYNVYPLFSYKLHAFTTFYAGVTNNFYNFGDPFGTRTTDRHYFVKMQYLFRY